MSSKYIDNSAYITSGYTLSGAYQSLTVGPAGVTGGPGMIGGTAASYTIVNRGTVTGTSFGIPLQDGGIVTNSVGARIEGGGTQGRGEALAITGKAGIVDNAGTIIGDHYGGVTLTAGGTVTNSGTAALIEGNGFEGGAIGIAGGTGIVGNTGTILAARYGSGVYLSAGGDVTNSGATALIEVFDGDAGVTVVGGAGTVTNSGTIESGVKYAFSEIGIGIDFSAGGSVANSGAGAVIHGGYDGVLVGAGLGTVANSGKIMANGASATGVWLKAGGSVTNADAAALIEGSGQGESADLPNWGVRIDGGLGTVSNSGTIRAYGTILPDGTAGAGVYFSVGGRISNIGSASLIEGYTGIIVGYRASGTVVNDGTIASTKGAAGTAIEFAAAGDVLVAEAGSRFIGTIQGGDGVLELAALAGTLSGLGTSFANFGTVSLEANARWTLAGANTIVTSLYLDTGASLTNTGTLLLTGRPNAGPDDGVYAAAGTDVTNAGTILADNNYLSGVVLADSGRVTNGKAALIDAGIYGVAVIGGVGTVANAGTIIGGYRGVGLIDGGIFTNSGTGALVRADNGVSADFGVVSTVANAGTIEATDGVGVYLQPGGLVTNTGAKALIFGYTGVDITGRGTVTNSGTIRAVSYPGVGIYLYTGGVIANATKGALIAGVVGVKIEHDAATIKNFGTIAGTGGTAAVLGGVGDVLIDEAGSHFTGDVVAVKGVLDLAGTAGTLSGLGSQFKGFANIDLLTGAHWTLAGDNTIAAGSVFTVDAGAALTLSGIFDIAGNIGIAVAGGSGVTNTGLLEKTGGTGVSTIAPAVVNTGTIRVILGTLNFDDAVSGKGDDVIGVKGTLKCDGAVSANQTASFAGTTGGELILDDPSGKALSFAGGIAGFKGSDKLDIASFVKAGAKLAWKQSGAKGILTITDGADTAKITLFGQYVLAGFKATTSAAGTVVTYTPPKQEVALAVAKH